MVRLLAHFSAPPIHKLHFNRFGLVPKSEPGQWGMIIDLSFPGGFSVNEGIPDSKGSRKNFRLLMMLSTR